MSWISLFFHLTEPAYHCLESKMGIPLFIMLIELCFFCLFFFLSILNHAVVKTTHTFNPRFSDQMTIALLIQNARPHIFILLHFRIFHNWTLQKLYVSLKKNIWLLSIHHLCFLASPNSFPLAFPFEFNSLVRLLWVPFCPMEAQTKLTAIEKSVKQVTGIRVLFFAIARACFSLWTLTPFSNTVLHILHFQAW